MCERHYYLDDWHCTGFKCLSLNRYRKTLMYLQSYRDLDNVRSYYIQTR